MREHIVINSDRSVTVPDSLKKIGIQYDHNVNTLTFDCPRYADDAQSIDMSKMQIFINWMLPDKSIGSSIAENIIIDEADSTLMHFDWIITSAVTPVFGILERTLVCIKQTDTDGREIYHWNTDLFQKFSVGEGMECNEQLAEENMDVITQLLVKMDAVDTRTSTEAMRSYVSEYMTENPPQPSDEQANAGVDAYMTENGQDYVNTYMGENAQSAVNTYMDVNAQSKVNTYMEENAQEHMDTYMEQNAQNKVDDYLERNPLQLDNTLTDPAKAAPADKVGEIGTEVDELKGDLALLAIYPIYGYPVASFKGYIDETGKVNTASKSTVFVYKSIPNATYIVETANHDIGSAFYIADFKEMPSVGSKSINFAYDADSATQLTRKTNEESKYIAVGKSLVNDSTNFTIKCDKEISDVFKVNEIKLNVGEKVYVNYFIKNKIVVESGITNDDTLGKVTDYIPTYGFEKMRIVMPVISVSESNWGLMFYRADKTPITESFNRVYVNRTNAYVKVLDVYIPDDAVYFRSSMWSDEYAREHNFSNELWYRFYDDKPVTHKKPLNTFAENVVKRAYQFVSIKWKPIADLPRYTLMDGEYSGSSPDSFHYTDKFIGDKEYIGLPYSFSGRLQYSDDFGYFALTVGHFVPFESFVTAVRYNNSIVYDKAITGINPHSVPYGADCMACVAYAFNWDYRDDSWSDIGSKSDNLGALTSLTVDKLMPADILVSSGHVLMITDVLKCGEKYLVETTEETTVGNGNNSIKGSPFGGLGRRKLWDEEEFLSWFREYDVRRVRNVFDIEYVPNEFAPILDEVERKPVVDLPCIPYMGNKFVFKAGYIPTYAKKVLIGATGFTKLVVEKMGQLLMNTTSIKIMNLSIYHLQALANIKRIYRILTMQKADLANGR